MNIHQTNINNPNKSLPPFELNPTIQCNGMDGSVAFSCFLDEHTLFIIGKI